MNLIEPWTQATITDSPKPDFYLLNGYIWKMRSEGDLVITHLDDVSPGYHDFVVTRTRPLRSGSGLLQQIIPIQLQCLSPFMPVWKWDKSRCRMAWSPVLYAFILSIADVPDTKDKLTWTIKGEFLGCRIDMEHSAWEEFCNRNLAPPGDEELELVTLPFSFRRYESHQRAWSNEFNLGA